MANDFFPTGGGYLLIQTRKAQFFLQLEINMLNLVTVCTDTYPLIYADKLHRKFDQLTNLNVEHYCITDRPAELDESINPICPFKK